MKGIAIYNKNQFNTIHSKTCISSQFTKTLYKYGSFYKCPNCESEYQIQNNIFIGLIPYTKNNIELCKNIKHNSIYPPITSFIVNKKGNIISYNKLN